MMNMLMELDHGRLGILLGFSAIVAFTLIAVSSVIASQWRKVRQSEVEAALKAQMLEQGMSAEEIEKVMVAGNRAKWMEIWAEHAGNCRKEPAGMRHRS